MHSLRRVDPIRDTPQVIALKLMKRYLNRRYANRDMKRPVSIYLSKIAALLPAKPNGLCAQLESYAAELDRRMTYAMESGKWPQERNPEFRPENFNDRWPHTIQDMRAFSGDLKHLIRELARARHSELIDIQKIFDDLFGERVSEKAIRSYADGLAGAASSSTYERGKGFVASPGLLRPAEASRPTTSRAKPHHFHPGKLK